MPDQAWLLILQELEAKELCVACSVSKHLSGLVHSAPFLWTRLYERTFGAQPEEEWSARVVKHVLCKRFVLPTKSPARVNKKNEGG